MTSRDARESGEEPVIKVVDRRKFTVDGDLRSSADAGEEPEPETEREPEAPPEPPPAEAQDATQGPDGSFQRQPLEEPEGVDFTMLINAMAEPALLFLGEIPHPGTNEAQIDPTRARLQIDMLTLLKLKCRGNLSAEEDSLLDRVLYQLRMLFVSRVGP